MSASDVPFVGTFLKLTVDPTATNCLAMPITISQNCVVNIIRGSDEKKVSNAVVFKFCLYLCLEQSY